MLTITQPSPPSGPGSAAVRPPGPSFRVSQSKSQRPETRAVIRLRPATIVAGRCHIRPRQATFRDGTNAPYKRGVTGSNPVAPTRSEGMLGGPVGSRRAKRRAVPLPGQARWLLLRRHQDVPATAGSEASRHISGRAARAGAAQAADHLKVGSCGKAAAGCSPRRPAPCSNSTTSDAASGRSPERSACATSEFPGAAAYVREH